MAKLNVAVFYGSRTVEHDVSVVTALQWMDNADSEKYNLIPVYIDREGRWFTGEKLRDIGFYRKFDPAAATQVYMEPTGGSRALYPVKQGMLGGRRPIAEIDVAVPAVHGMNGEDGTLQGLFELMNLPYTSPGVLGSALGMDKIAMKLAFQGAGLPVLPYVWLERGAFEGNAEAEFDRIERALGYPVFVKPANLGSSIGINRADDRAALNEALAVAFSYDRRAVVEHGVSDPLEINCSALGIGADVRASFCEQPVSWKEFLTFDQKYLRGNTKGAKGGAVGTKGAEGSGAKGGGMENMQRLIPAPIGEELTAEVQRLTIEAFRLLDCRGVVRVDYIIEKATNALYINEINTVPGSFAFYLWEPTGLPYQQLIDAIISQALAAHREKGKNSYAYESGLLNKFQKGGAKG